MSISLIFRRLLTLFGIRGYVKLQQVAINGNFLNLRKYLYGKSKCAIKIKNRITDFFNYSEGVRQGCPLSPVLFTFMTFFVARDKHSIFDVYLDATNKIDTLMYADNLLDIQK